MSLVSLLQTICILAIITQLELFVMSGVVLFATYKAWRKFYVEKKEFPL